METWSPRALGWVSGGLGWVSETSQTKYCIFWPGSVKQDVVYGTAGWSANQALYIDFYEQLSNIIILHWGLEERQPGTL